jgi:hypothetical protein
MQDLSDEDRKQVLGEVLSNQLTAISEGISNLPTKPDFSRLEEKVDTVINDMKSVKAAVTDLTSQVTTIDSRTTALENVA